MAKEIEELGERTGPGEMSLFVDDENESAEEKRAEHLMDLGQTMQKNVSQRVSERAPIEQRMLSDLRQYKGLYEPNIASKLKQNKHGSDVFVKMTKSKTNFAEAQIMFMGMPNDERNWDIRSTPVPELVEGLNDNTPVEDPNQPGAQATDDVTGQPITEGDLNAHEITQAQDRAKRMRKEIDDQLIEAKYATHMRDVIHNAAMYGTGILKGPQVIARHRRAWIQNSDDSHTFSVKVDQRPFVQSVSPWHFFPDLSTNDPTELEDVFERHMMTKSQLRKLAKQPGFMTSQIRKVLEETEPGPDNNENTLSAELQAISEIANMVDDKRYRVWEYHGPLAKEDLEAAKIKVDLDDEMEDYHGVVWFCNGIVIKVAINMLDTNALPYYVLNWEPDESTVFGYGVPYALRDPQRIANAAWRMVLDNAGLSTGPQIFMRRKGIVPADGVWQLTPRKIWYVNDEITKVRDAVMPVDISGHFGELFSIYDKALEMAEQDSNLPKVTQGEHSQARETFSGLALRTNIANLPQRRVIKNLDDHVIKPFVTNMYDYNMQFNENNDIKGDYEVLALGSDVLVTREIQAQILLQMMQFASDPIYGPWIKPADLLKQALKSNHIAPGEIIKTQEEYDRDIQRQKEEQQPPQPSPDAQLKSQTELKKTEMQENTKLQIAIGKNEAKIFELEQQMTMLAEKSDRDAENKRAELNLQLTKLRQERERFIAELRRKDVHGTGI